MIRRGKRVRLASSGLVGTVLQGNIWWHHQRAAKVLWDGWKDYGISLHWELEAL